MDAERASVHRWLKTVPPPSSTTAIRPPPILPRSSPAHGYVTLDPTPKTRVAPMPPAISDDESDGDVPEEIPAKAVKAPNPSDEDEEEDDDSEEGEDEYVVEDILKHRNTKGTLQYRIKWLGYDDEADITWEPLENLKTASVKLSEYHDRIGGAPTKAAAASSAKKSLTIKRSASALDSPAPATKKSRTSTGATNGTPSSSKDLPKGSWEENITRIISIIEESETTKSRAGGGKVLMAYADWKDNVKRKHKLSTLRGKAPQHLLTYYERHLVFRSDEDSTKAEAET
ncbi:hypothetical protein B0A48_10455 [Cryoendolithus antarcticus]|uniref:Chromo domain-containing protein n=1 Tax=Cryoendolithus antarcticus TaxID=1507870 RepID=A0A1V8SXK7_9PEZI|nr:hypothetical protein B0A48_10455 [Cryoendolithus antarcticus]